MTQEKKSGESIRPDALTPEEWEKYEHYLAKRREANRAAVGRIFAAEVLTGDDLALVITV